MEFWGVDPSPWGRMFGWSLSHWIRVGGLNRIGWEVGYLH
jgi:hypothetical protein